MSLTSTRRLVPAAAMVSVASLWCSTGAAEARAARTVLVISWGAEDYQATPIVNAAIRQAVKSDPHVPIDYFTEYLEADRLPPDNASQALVDSIRRKYRGRRIDLVIAIADPTLRFVLDHREELFPDAPIVYSGLAIPTTIDQSVGAGLTGVLRGVAYGKTLTLALKLHPSAERVFIIAQSADREAVSSAQREFRDFSQRVRLAYLHAATQADLLAAVKAIPPRSVILYAWYTPDVPRPDMYSDDIVRHVAEASAVPVYALLERYVGSGIVGGAVRETRETGIRVGEMALQILKGTRPQDIPIEEARLVPTFDWRQMKRWGIDASSLPPGSDIRFVLPTALRSYGWYFVGASGVIAAQLALIVGLFTQRARRRRAEGVIHRREAALRRSYERSRQLARRLIAAQEDTRAEIARDLHDSVCQELACISMAVGRLKDSPGRTEDVMTHALSALEEDMLAVVDEIQHLSRDLHPGTLPLLGLATTLKAHCLEVEKSYPVRVSFATAGEVGRLPPDVDVSLFRILQESLRNGIVHGEAQRLAVSFIRSGEQIELTITDDGRGFDLEHVRQHSSGLGLVSLEERARMIGGALQIVTRPGQGTVVRVQCPCRACAEPLTSPPTIGHIQQTAKP
jgi:signal transduction histidine kinase